MMIFHCGSRVIREVCRYMLPKEIVRKIRRIQITTNRLVNESLGGEYHSVFKGRGMEFDEVREYQHGDDIRTIDWNVTSRTGHPFVKRYRGRTRTYGHAPRGDVAPRALSDPAAKPRPRWPPKFPPCWPFPPSKPRSGRERFCSRIAWKSSSRPRRGSTHVLRVIRELLFYRPERQGTRIQHALEHLNLVVRKRAVVFLISDLLDQGFETPLKVANRDMMW